MGSRQRHGWLLNLALLAFAESAAAFSSSRNVAQLLHRHSTGASCDAATADVDTLRRSPWPQTARGPAPSIAKLVYLNLDESADRRKFMEKQLGEIRGNGSTFEVERFAALTADQVRSEPRFEAWRKRGFNPMSFPKLDGHWGTAANMLSKYEALRQLDAAKLPPNSVAMLLEDDATISPSFQKEWDELWPYVPEDWDLLRVGGFRYDSRNCTQFVNKHVDRAAWFDPPPRVPGHGGGPCQYCGSQAYIVRPGGLSRVLRRVETLRMVLADVAYGAATPPHEDAKEVMPLRIYQVRPFLVYEEPQFGSVRDQVDERQSLRGKAR